ncbi:MAG: prepilin-type N-terminal cleavage/methylation domain-containing protein [Planctomycetota bacterium]
MRKPHHPNLRSGLTLIELAISMLVVAALMLAAVTAFTRNLGAVRQAKSTSNGAIFLQATMENLAAQPFDNLLALNGNQFFDRTTLEDSSFAVDLTVFLSDVDLLQVEADLIDLRTDRRMGQLTTLRTRR